MMEFQTATTPDVKKIFELYDEAIEFQKTVFHKHWLAFDQELVAREIAEVRLWKIIDDTETACIFSVAYEDPIIWGEKSGDKAMYIHRIVTASSFHGRGYVRSITDWAKAHAKERGLRFVRMDTWGDNPKLIEYYQQCGFTFVGIVSPEESATLPKHYSGISLSLFEIDLA
ncbi:MAG TPA: GNAT family N-acetyltransferase [Pyrinomonadaceae bacterium]|nr:GNAT family N-acetyltransferase [Pyrinomonadaceae bacterium]